MTEDELQALEIRLLLEGVFHVYGYDFREYAESSLIRRARSWLAASGFSGAAAAQERVLRDPALLRSLVQGITVNVTEMFRDPGFFRGLREHVLPRLREHPLVKVWVAGCATGEEAYSMAILLEEEGLGERSRIYATDLDPQALERAEKGIYPLRDLRTFTRNYQLGGGRAAFSDYYTARYEHALLDPVLRQRILFASHNLATDREFGEMHLILCRNVLIYFKQPLKERVLELFQGSLAPGGFLCLGLKESLLGHGIAPHYEETVPRLRIYRKAAAAVFAYGEA
jgi:chemotaxis protein methyltransferase CheR